MQLMPDFRLHRPASVAEAAALLAAPAGGKPLGGGTDLLVNLRRGLGEPASLLDLQGIAELAAVTTDAGGVTIGAAVTLERLAEHPAILDGWPAVAAAAAFHRRPRPPGRRHGRRQSVPGYPLRLL